MERRINRLMLVAAAPAAMLLGMSVAPAQEPVVGHPAPQPRFGLSEQTMSEDGTTTFISTQPSVFEEQDPWLPPEGSNQLAPSNLLETLYVNVQDSAGKEIPNTLPSTPENPYNLHDDPVVTEIDPREPSGDLLNVLNQLQESVDNRGSIDAEAVQFAIDILEGNPIDRTYSGMPLLHYKGAEKVKTVEPIFDDEGNVVGGNVDVHQVWMHQHIESDTAFIDPSAVQDVPWTITYTLDALERGKEDFAPMMMTFDDPNIMGGNRVPNVAMDQTFFPMEAGTRTVLKMKMPPARYWNLTYHWGWRIHPPRVQVIENALKVAMGRTLPEWEEVTFGPNPSASEEAKLAAIAMIGDLAPAKRMWNAFRTLQTRPNANAASFQRQIEEARNAFYDWRNRNYLPSGVEPDPDADITLLYANNTIYGQAKGFTRETHDMQRTVDSWRTRGDKVKVALYNADYYPHAYVNIDFGGRRGWENTFQNTIPVGGQGPWFTFGRFHWWPNTAAPVMVAAAERLPAQTSDNPVAAARARLMAGGDAEEDQGPIAAARARFLAGELALPEAAEVRERAARNPMLQQPEYLRAPGREMFPAANRNAMGLGHHNVELTMNFEPSTRIRMYQFDPLHHDVAIWSVH